MADYVNRSSTPWYSYRSGITTIVIQDGVTTVGSEAFRGCSSLTAINVDAGNPRYFSKDGVLFGYKGWLLQDIDLGELMTLLVYPPTKTGSYTIPNLAIAVDSYAFENCTGLTGVTFPNSVYAGYIPEIGDIVISAFAIASYAFQDCTGLTSVIFPNSAKIIQGGAFSGCTGLTTVTNVSPTPDMMNDLSINVNAFQSVNMNACTLRVPVGSVDAYKAAAIWKDFGTIVEIE
jgi:hypothetical protein